jgi:hypothetical protein
MKKKNWRPSFKRWLHEDLQNQVRRLYDIVYCFSINNSKDRAKWDWEKSGIFSVKSTYKYLSRLDVGLSFKKIWNAKIPLKIRIFMWLVSHDAILTKDNLIKQKWNGNSSCAFCTEKKDGQHLFFWLSFI